MWPPPPATPMASSSSMVLETLQSLPDDVRQHAIERLLLPLLDKASMEDSEKALSGFVDLKNRYRNCPDLDLRQRKAEVGGLLDALDIDCKRNAVIRGRSIRKELLDEALMTLGAWLNDVWVVTAEFETGFDRAHLCLLEISSLVDEVFSDGHGSCKCGFNRDTFVPLRLRDHTGRVVKRFSRLGPDNIKQATLWVWRDLFLSMLASGTQWAIGRLPLMFADITDARGIPALERILYGGEIYAKQEYDEDDPEGIQDDDSSDSGDGDARMDEGEGERSNVHAAHWSPKLERQVQHLHKHVITHLFAVFGLSPSAPLYHTLERLYQGLETAVDEGSPLRSLNALVPLTPTMLVSTLNIYIQLDKPRQIDRLISSHSHMVRPWDHTTLTFAALNMSRTPATVPCAVALLTKELLAVSHTLRAMLRRVFPFMEAPIYVKDLKEIMDLLPGSLKRLAKVQVWVKSIASIAAPPVVIATVGTGAAAPPPMPVSMPVTFTDGAANNPFWNVNPNMPPNAPPMGGMQVPLPPHAAPAAAGLPPPPPPPAPQVTAVAALNIMLNANIANAANIFGAGAPGGAGFAPGGGAIFQAIPVNIPPPGALGAPGGGGGAGGAGGWPFVAAVAQNDDEGDDIEDQYGPNPGIFVTAQPGQRQTWGGWAGPHGSYSFGPLDFGAGSKRVVGAVDEEGVSVSWEARDAERWGSMKDARDHAWMEELADLKEEFRPRMKERWDAWMRLSTLVNGAGDVLRGVVYAEVLSKMPFLDAGDVVQVMIDRLSERQSKHYICDSLESIYAFCCVQKLANSAPTPQS